MLGPYLRPVLYWTIGISIGISVLFFVMTACARTRRNQDDYVKAAVAWLVFAATVGGFTLFQHFMGMP
jgi:hypothetical protein